MGSGIIQRLIDKGVQIPNPETVTVGEEVDVDRISARGVVLFPGSRLSGGSTLISDDVRIGTEGPATLEDCKVGAGTALSSGAFTGVVFLGKNRVGPGAHFREGTILEEAARAAHTVGLKQTILFPWVTLGSLVNFCDCLMAGGTGPANHSEVGSSYIHFNFTPNQDKATPSLIGDVPRGVMLNRPPIFLGGQGGMVGPVRVEYGTVAASGMILRKDVVNPDHIVFEAPRRSFTAPNVPGMYRNVRKIIRNNLHYIANLKALEAWYEQFRPMTVSMAADRHLLKALRMTLSENGRERIFRLGRFVDKLPESLQIYKDLMGDEASGKLVAEKKQLIERWPEAEQILQRRAEFFESPALRDRFLESVEASGGEAEGYIAAVQGLSQTAVRFGVDWLQAIVEKAEAETYSILNAFAPDGTEK